MPRSVPGSGAVIKPIFDEIFGVRAIKVLNGGSGYDPTDPPRLVVEGCGTPDVEALLYPIIDQDSGKITHVRVLERGRGYDPLRLQIIPEQETPNIVSSFNINRIWQGHPNSSTIGQFQTIENRLSDRLRIQSDNHPKPTPIQTEREYGNSLINDRNFDQTFIYRGGKDVPDPGERAFQNSKVVGILANGGLLHTSSWFQQGGAPAGFNIDTIKYDYIKNYSDNDTNIDNGIQYYHTSKLINEFSQTNGVFEWGKLKLATWQVKVEHDNVMLPVDNVDESLGNVEVGRIVDEIGGNAKGEIAKISRNNLGQITRIYLRNLSVQHSFSNGDLCLGSNGFTFRINSDPIAFTNGVFYIEFGEDAEDFGPFTRGIYYFAPQNVTVPANYLIIWDQSHASNRPTDMHEFGHPMQFSTTPDGVLNENPGTLYYNSTGPSGAPSTDYENQWQPLFIMNPDEGQRIYYYCKYHNHMSGYIGDEGYMTIKPNHPPERIVNDYYTTNFYQSDLNDSDTIDYSRHPDGHSKILGLSFDGYPIYGPYGYNSSGTAAREVSSYRLKIGNEIDGTRPPINTASTVTYNVTYANGKFNFNGSVPNFLTLDRGSTYIFNQDDSSNENQYLLLSPQTDGWHSSNPAIIGVIGDLYSGEGLSYYLNGSETTYSNYIAGFNSASTREIRFQVPVNAAQALHLFSYTTSGAGVRTVQRGYILGDLIQDYIYDSGVGTLDEFNGKFGVTPEYPNGTYAYFMVEDGSGNPVYPYAIGPKYYGVPLFEGNDVPPLVNTFPFGAEGEVVLADDGSVSYVKMTANGDNYYGPTKAKILGGEGSGATGTPTVQTVTGLSILNSGRNYATPPTLVFEGGGGQGAQGAATIDTSGRITSISIVDPGEFYQEPPYILITGGGGSGAKAQARIDQGEIVGIDVIDEGKGYITQPSIIFTKLVNLKRTTRARQAFNSSEIFLTGLTRNVTANDLEIFVKSTDAFPGSGELILGTETITYTSKTFEKFGGLTRGVNFNYDQRIILDSSQDDRQFVSTYKFNVGDRVIRRTESSSNKVAKVYDWNPTTKELLVVFEIDELAFIDAGTPTTEDAIVQFDAGIPASSTNSDTPHVLIVDQNNNIPLLTNPLSVLEDRNFEDNDENEDPNNPGVFLGDGIPDLVNTGTQYENQINLDGGIYNSLYGIEETQGGTNTTLFSVGEQIKDASIPLKYATVVTAGGLNEGVEHIALIDIYLDTDFGNGQNFQVNETVTGQSSGVQATVVSWNANDSILTVKDVLPYNTGNVNVGSAGVLYQFSDRGTIVDVYIQDSGTNYTAAPTITFENSGDVQATGTVNLTDAGDQVESVTITNGGYGYEQTIDGTYALHPTITFTNDPSDTTGSDATAYAILGGETILGSGGGSYRIKRIEYQTNLRS